MRFKYEIVKTNSMYPAKIYLQDKPGRRCDTSLHWHSYMVFLYIIDGALNVMEEGKVTPLHSGKVYFVNHDRFHRTFSDTPDENVRYLVVLLSYEQLQSYYPNMERLEFGLCNSDDAMPVITDMLCRIAACYERRLIGYEMKINALLHEIYYLLISRCFKNITRTSAMQYIANLRLESALREIVFKNKSVTDAAFDNGFTSVKSLIEECKKTDNCTPGQLNSAANSNVELLWCPADITIR